MEQSTASFEFSNYFDISQLYNFQKNISELSGYAFTLISVDGFSLTDSETFFDSINRLTDDYLQQLYLAGINYSERKVEVKTILSTQCSLLYVLPFEIHQQAIAYWLVLKIVTDENKWNQFIASLTSFTQMLGSAAEKNIKFQAIENQTQKHENLISLFENKLELYVSNSEKTKQILRKEMDLRNKEKQFYLSEYKLFKSLVDFLPIGIFAKKVHSNFEYFVWNNAMEHIYNLTAADVLGKKDEQVFGADAELIKQQDKELMDSDSVFEIKSQEYTTNNETKYLNIGKLAVKNENGVFDKIIGYVQNVTTWRIAEIELQQYQNELEKRVEEKTTELKDANLLLAKQNYEHNVLNEELLSQNEELNVLNEELEKSNEKNTEMNEKLIQNQVSLLKAQAAALICNWELALHSHEIEVSDFFFEILGYQPNEKYLYPKRLLQIIYPPDYFPLLRSLIRTVTENKPQNYIFRFYTRKNQMRIARIMAEAIVNGKRIFKIFGTFQDITDIYNIENALKESEAKFKSIFENSPIGLFHFDKNGCVTECNDAFARIVGSSKELIVGFDMLHSINNKKLQQKLEITLQGNKTQYTGAYWGLNSDNTTPVKVDLTPLFSQNNELIGGLGIVEDITEQMRAKDRAKRSKNYHHLRADMWELIASRTITSEKVLINKLLELVGNRITATRINMYKLIGSNILSLHYQWHEEGAEKGINELHINPDIATYMSNNKFTELSEEIVESQFPEESDMYYHIAEIKSFIQEMKTQFIVFFPYEINNRVEGFITFQRDKSNDLAWQQGDIYIGIDLCNLIAVVISKMRTEMNLRENEEKYRTLIENSNDGIFIESQRLITFTNNQFRDLVRYTENELKNAPLTKVIEVEHLRNVLEFQRKKYSGSVIGNLLETELVSKYNETIPVEFNTSIIKYNNVVSSMTIVRDLTSRKNAEIERNRLVAAIEQIYEAVIITSTDSIIEYVNPAFEKMTGYKFDEVKGFSTKVFKSGKHGTDFYEKMWKTIRKGDTWTGNIINRKKDGTPYNEYMVISAIKNSSGQVVNYVAIKRDITEEMRMEEHLNQMQKLQAIGTLAGGIAHDFNNILMGMMMFTELLKINIDNKENSLNNISKIEQAIIRAKDLVAQILAFSRQNNEVVTPNPIRIDHAISEAMKLIRATLPTTLKIDITIEYCGYVIASATNIHQVIMNLCTNANHAMDGMGVLRISLVTKNVQDVTIGNLDKNIPRWVELKVSDTGQGMTEEVRQRIYEPFFTTKEVGKGTGLGMATVFGIVKRYNGAIEIESEIGKGSTFYVYFPQHQE